MKIDLKNLTSENHKKIDIQMMKKRKEKPSKNKLQSE